MSEYHELLRCHSLRDTTPRREVFRALSQAETPLSIADIVRVCSTINRTTVYRTLEIFGTIGVVQAVPVGWKQRYELTSLFVAHHHHMQCVSCGRVIDIASPKLERLVREIADSHDWTARSHTFELTGVCADCRTAGR